MGDCPTGAFESNGALDGSLKALRPHKKDRSRRVVQDKEQEGPVGVELRARRSLREQGRGEVYRRTRGRCGLGPLLVHLQERLVHDAADADRLFVLRHGGEVCGVREGLPHPKCRQELLQLVSFLHFEFGHPHVHLVPGHGSLPAADEVKPVAMGEVLQQLVHGSLLRHGQQHTGGPAVGQFQAQ